MSGEPGNPLVGCAAVVLVIATIMVGSALGTNYDEGEGGGGWSFAHPGCEDIRPLQRHIAHERRRERGPWHEYATEQRKGLQRALQQARRACN